MQQTYRNQNSCWRYVKAVTRRTSDSGEGRFRFDSKQLRQFARASNALLDAGSRLASHILDQIDNVVLVIAIVAAQKADRQLRHAKQASDETE